MNDAGFSLELRFPDQSPSFAYGFEAGSIYELMRQGELVIDRGFNEGFPLRVENTELYNGLANLKSYVIERGEEKDGWIPTRFTKSKEVEATTPKLRIVE
jgi:hypothetical protein